MTKTCQATILGKVKGGVNVILHLLDGSNIEVIVPTFGIINNEVKFNCKDGIAKVLGSKVWTWTKNIYVP